MVKFHWPLTVQFASIMALMTDSIQKLVKISYYLIEFVITKDVLKDPIQYH